MSKFADNVVRIPCSLGSEFFEHWFEFLKPFHHLTEKEAQVAAAFMRHRHRLSKAIHDEAILDMVVMSEDTKRLVREDCNMTLPHFHVVMSKLRSQGMIVDGKLNKRFIPKISEEEKNLKLMILFEFSEE